MPEVLEILLTWSAPMDDAHTPANDSWTVTVDGAPVAIDAQLWLNPTQLLVSGTGVLVKPTTVTLSYAGGDPGLKTGHGDVVEAFDLGEISECP